ncbi:MAG: hypothetical protein SFX72_13085 [Isosphaeraceae bacterium]|nr:hypothetical protein [Isosphaeraceae bacterium]
MRLDLDGLLRWASGLAAVGLWIASDALSDRSATARGLSIAATTAAVIAAYAFGRARREPARSDTEAIGPILERIATALERSPGVVERAPGVATEDLGEVRRAIVEGEWKRVELLLAAHVDHPAHALLVGEAIEARRTAASRLRDELEAARAAPDPERVLELHDAMVELLEEDELREFRKAEVGWFVKLIMKRMRTGTVRVDVAELAAKVADRFATTVEGASLRASLPTLRRSAGLCPRCGQAYRGLGDACPACLTASTGAAAPRAEPQESEIEEEAVVGSDEDRDLLDSLRGTV